jgi:hypothetical protein
MTLFNEVVGIIVILDVITILLKLMLIKRHYYTKDILLNFRAIFITTSMEINILIENTV